MDQREAISKSGMKIENSHRQNEKKRLHGNKLFELSTGNKAAQRAKELHG